MDLVKIGKFIVERRKELNLTQLDIADKLSITDRAVSKWENGKALPDASLMLDLCSILQINVNDLLNGEIVTMDEKQKNDELLLEMVKEKQNVDKMLLRIEVFIGIISTLIIVGSTMLGGLLEIETWQRIVIIVVGFIVGLVGLFIAIKIEQIAGYYECKKCGYRYVPTFMSVTNAMHMGRTRKMRCPKCNQKSWQRKVIKK